MKLNAFDNLSANEKHLRPVIWEGREWTLSTITPFDDLEGEAGEHPRAQYRARQKLKPDRTHTIRFNIVLPKDWIKYNKEVAIFDIHGHKVAAQTMDIFIKDDHFLVIIKDRPGPAVHSRFMKKFITEHPYEFRLVTHITNNEQKGYYRCFVNEQEWFYIYGIKTMFDGEGEEGPYWKAGLYVPVRNWPEGITERKILLQV